MEYIRSVVITAEVDTNKETYRGVFDNIEEAHEWIGQRMQQIDTQILGPNQRVFTASEVKAMLEHMLDDNFFMHGDAGVREEKIRHMAKTHGIPLDEA